MGWAAAVGPSLEHNREAEELVTLLAQCATGLLGRRSSEAPCQQERSRWEDAARDGYWEWDFETGVMRFSRRSLALLDRTASTARRNRKLARPHPSDDKAGVYAALLTAATGAGHRGPRAPRRAARRSVSRLVVRAVAEHDNAGRPIRLVGWLCDVSRTEACRVRPRKAQIARRRRTRGGQCRARLQQLPHDHSRPHRVGTRFGRARQPGGRESGADQACGGRGNHVDKTTAHRPSPAHAGPNRRSTSNEVVAGAERTLRSLVGTRGELVIKLRPAPGLVRADAAQIHRLLDQPRGERT